MSIKYILFSVKLGFGVSFLTPIKPSGNVEKNLQKLTHINSHYLNYVILKSKIFDFKITLTHEIDSHQRKPTIFLHDLLQVAKFRFSKTESEMLSSVK